MDFFTQQDKARRNTGWLVVLFILAVLGLIFLTNLLIGVVVWFMTQEETMQRGVSVIAQTDTRTVASLFSWHTFGLISLGVAGAVSCAIVYKWVQLSSGGKAVAEALGGIRISPDTADADQRQVLNVVEEMALASGMPVPAVFLLADEPGINAFAAGNSPSDAVIGVTQGCIQHFKRDELQGVIAHEFSHILNGDMRLNLRLVALLHGIVFIGLVGESMARSGRHRRSDGRVALLGIALMVVGWLGTFFGNLIKAAVSRQREFLADASAVQFTRNPDGISNALKLIGGYKPGSGIISSNSSEVSHLFFGQALHKLSGLHATHPPLVDRILRIDPDWDGNYLFRGAETRELKQQADVEKQQKRERFKQTVIAGASVSAGVDLAAPEMPVDLDEVRDEIDAIPSLLAENAKEPLGAIAICYGLLLHEEPSLKSDQAESIAESGFAGLTGLVERVEKEIALLPNELRLTLIELLLPALKCMSDAQYKQFKRTLMKLIRADQKTDLFEWCLYQVVRHYLAGEFEPNLSTKPTFKEPGQVSQEYQLVLSVLAYHGHAEREDAERAFNRGAGAAGLYNIRLLEQEECDLNEFMQAVITLGGAYPLLKPRLINGFRKCIAHDNKVTHQEREIVTSIAAVMDSPVPVLEGL
ncbi:M48 family metallopeptidase [uncultured Neptuniibacter sp.]|uniref:M48 family metallopeptidase n=1 Tax=uncultured Neptuniibacter sp. TaxID=502143 RepID=UPI002629A686|nr:M48 family metallopeptidase [uncultured Neptuniibacter sp.]